MKLRKQSLVIRLGAVACAIALVQCAGSRATKENTTAIESEVRATSTVDGSARSGNVETSPNDVVTPTVPAPHVMAPGHSELPVAQVDAGPNNPEPDPDPTAVIDDAVYPEIDLADLHSRLIYPELARKNNIEGTVVVAVLVERDGRASRYRIESSDNDLLTEAAVRGVMASRFKPGSQGGKPIRLWCYVPVKYSLNN